MPMPLRCCFSLLFRHAIFADTHFRALAAYATLLFTRCRDDAAPLRRRWLRHTLEEMLRAIALHACLRR